MNFQFCFKIQKKYLKIAVLPKTERCLGNSFFKFFYWKMYQSAEILNALLITLYYYFNVFENCHAIIWRMKQIWFYWQVLVIWNHIIGLHHHILNPQAFQFYFALLSTASFSYYSIDLSCRFDSSSFIFCSSSFFLFLACSFDPVYL